MLQQRERFRNDLVEVDGAEFRGAGAREIQQVVDDLRSAEGLARDFFQQRAELGVAIDLLGQHLRVAGDDGQRRIDFMRHAGGQQADG